MDIPNNNKLNILNLPNEILLFIFNKLKTIDALYSLVDVNERFDRLIFDSLHIRNLDTTSMVLKSYYNRNFSIDKNVLLRISEKILPRIYHQLNELIVEQYSMEHILFAFNYPQLYSLSLVNFQEEMLFECLTGDSILHHLLTQQITDLNVDVPYKPKSKVSESLSNIFALILSISQRLINLNFCQLFPYQKTTISIYKLPSTSCVSSTLTKLKVNVETFDDCLYLVRHLKYLLTLIIDVKKISLSFYDRNNKEKLPELKYFSLTSMMFTSHYDDQIIPLLRRMINLKELKLFLAVLKNHSTYIDGIQLHDEILIHMPQLNKFTFSINTIILNENIKIDLPSNEDIQHSFIGKIYGKVGSYVYVRSEDNVVVSHVYSLPYQFQYFLHLANYFQGDMFHTVRHLTMHDGRPFEYNLFKIISQRFPLLKELCVINCIPQKNKQHSPILIIFPHLILLDLVKIHVDYAEQLLFDKNTHLPSLLDLCIKYKSLAMITNDFTNNPIRGNCAKIKKLLADRFIRPKNFHEYFPLL
ncbi:unnamed protein product [Rotaria magnacalcarata]|uniref:F-box domain-containing protein n=2 Tax=Rotaria magnacalcarata TaxID=392030 RepID=A0A816V7W7_9BILA|nr:unnamed protein product [Rotaria magnacalcarata]CAF4086073.1 unnamed protein product [Rotaria magnacalcarata]